MAQKYLDLVTVQAMGDVQVHYYVHQTILSKVLLCVYHAAGFLQVSVSQI